MEYITNTIAQSFDACSYGGSAYGNGSCQATTGTSGGTGSTGRSGALTNTGFDILLAATLACVIIFAALMVRFWKRSSKHQTPET